MYVKINAFVLNNNYSKGIFRKVAVGNNSELNNFDWILLALLNFATCIRAFEKVYPMSDT